MSGLSAGHDQSVAGLDTKSGQRRQVTVLFADMVGYTALAERLGEEKTYLLMQKIHKALNEAIHAEEGTVQEMTGDGVMALFGAPVAVEHSSLRGCRAALDIQRRVAALASEIEAEHGEQPTFRVGIHSGPLVVGEVGDERQSGITALGDTVNLASRIEAQADAGQIMLSEATYALVEGFVDAVFVGERAIKGKAGAQKLWRLDAVKEGITRFDVARGRGLLPLIGRSRELERLESVWRETTAGTVHAVSIAGEPGIGKSRLAYEFRQRTDDGRTVFLEGHCSADSQSTPFAPLIDLVRSSFRITDGADAAEATGKLTQGLEILGISPEETLPYLLNLLGFPPGDAALDHVAGETLGIRTRDAILAMLRERCRISPTVIIVDGLQWVDTATEGLLQRIVESDDSLPLLVLATARTGYTPPWVNQGNATELRLKPLTASATNDLLKSELDGRSPPDDLAALVVEKSQGNPLFVEEIVAFLRGAGTLRDEDEEIVFERDKAGAALPVTIENLLMDRFDRLAYGPRAAIEVAAVIGPRFSEELLIAATGGDLAGKDYLQALLHEELIEVEPSGDAYRFRHPLARDSIYDSLLTPRRHALHQSVGAALEAKHTDHPAEISNLLAHHWSHTDRADKAIRYLTLAGETALRVYSLDEAERNFRQAIHLVGANPGSIKEDALADLLLSLARTLYFQGEFFAVIDLVEPYLPALEALGDTRRLSRFLFETGYAHVFAAKVEKGRTLLTRARRFGEEAGDDLAIAYADLGFMWDRLFWGEPGSARSEAQREAATRLVSVGRINGDIWLASKAQLALGFDHLFWGRTGDGLAALMGLLAMSRETNDPRPRSMALWALAAHHAFAGDCAEAVENADDSLRVSLSPVDRDSAQVYKSMAMVLSDQVTEGLALGMQLNRDVVGKGFVMVVALPKMILGVGTVRQGDMAAGVRMIKKAAAEAAEWGQTAAHAFGNLMLGEIYLHIALGNEKPPFAVMLRNLPFLVRTLPFAKAKSQRHLKHALAAFRDYDCPAHAARCLYDLAQLDQARKQTSAARVKLEEARQLATSVEDTKLIKDIDKALVKLTAA